MSIVRRIALGAWGALFFAAVLHVGAAQAVTLTLTFTGKVKEIDGSPFPSASVGQDFTGAYTLDYTAFVHTPSGDDVAAGIVAFATPFFSSTGPGAININHSSNRLLFGYQTGENLFNFVARGDPSGTPVTLLSLMPSLAATEARFGSAISFFGQVGKFPSPALNRIVFDITDYTLTETPIPPALLMFATALCSLGFSRWRGTRSTQFDPHVGQPRSRPHPIE